MQKFDTNKRLNKSFDCHMRMRQKKQKCCNLSQFNKYGYAKHIPNSEFNAESWGNFIKPFCEFTFPVFQMF